MPRSESSLASREPIGQMTKQKFLAGGKPSDIAIARSVFLITCTFIIFMLLDYDTVWIQPEMPGYRLHILNAPNVSVAFDWHALENDAPRLTRLLSNFGEVADVYFRKWFLATVFPHPSISLTWIFTLFLSPIVLYRALGLLGLDPAIRWLGLSVYMASFGYLASLAMGFRFGKPVASFFFIVLLYYALKDRRSRASGYDVALAGVAFAASLFFDETAIFGLAIVVAIALSDIRRLWRLPAVLAFILIVYVPFSKVVLPVIYAKAGYPINGDYDMESRLSEIVALKVPWSNYEELFATTRMNVGVILADLSSISVLFDPQLSLWVIAPLTLCALAWAAFYLPHEVKASPSSVPAYMFALLLLFGIGFHSILVFVTPHKIWSVYWYGGFLTLPWATIVALVLNRANRMLACAITFVLVLGSLHAFRATNYAVKNFHYYPYRPNELARMFRWEVNRFTLYRDSVHAYQLKELTRGYVDRQGPKELPAELGYLEIEVPHK